MNELFDFMITHFHPGGAACRARPKERFEAWIKMIEMVKADIESGALTSWGIYHDASGGYAFSKLKPNELYTMILKWSPFVMFDAKPVLNADQAIESMKKAVESS